jgi:hypothetical protein
MKGMLAVNGQVEPVNWYRLKPVHDTTMSAIMGHAYVDHFRVRWSV